MEKNLENEPKIEIWHVFFPVQLGDFYQLVVEPTHLKNITVVKLDHFPKVRGENKKYLKPSPSLGFSR